MQDYSCLNTNSADEIGDASTELETIYQLQIASGAFKFQVAPMFHRLTMRM